MAARFTFPENCVEAIPVQARAAFVAAGRIVVIKDSFFVVSPAALDSVMYSHNFPAIHCI